MKNITFKYLGEVFGMAIVEDINYKLINVFRKDDDKVVCISFDKKTVMKMKGKTVLEKTKTAILEDMKNDNVAIQVQTFEKEFWKDVIEELKTNGNKNLVIKSL